jgi:hypothetical protein
VRGGGAADRVPPAAGTVAWACAAPYAKARLEVAVGGLAEPATGNAVRLLAALRDFGLGGSASPRLIG